MMGLIRQALIFVVTIATAIHSKFQIAVAVDIGVCYGLLGDNLPPATDVINLYKKYGVEKTRLFDPNPAALNALRGSGIKVIVGIRNEDLPNLAASPAAVTTWFSTNIEPYLKDVLFSVIAVGNEIIPGVYAPNILPVMQSLQNILNAKGLGSTIRVSTVVAAVTLGSSYPPSSGAFTPEASSTLKGVLTFLSQQGSPLLINVYPYFAYAGDPVNVKLDYAQFTATAPVVTDGSLSYYNLFDAVVDAFFSAMEKEGVSNVNVTVSESGWPSAGNGDFTTPQLAATYNRNFINHITSNKGTPKRPNAHIEGFIFATFNENQKPAGTEQNFGLFFPNMQPVYPVFS
ncbi:hypothetical protein Ddye_024670 [Dipteronia dyeriana]|uniref:glucan endo-1,3-beta-D-glucosidase n=1 Tax=Dipteronia dyeriana TaxID=168575 RepID=A0AAD9TVI4_9ROSI|nr:hypothetical protein Ddye_024670 [Dipteronia dyeriana]